jgi:hypothetical protein
MRMLMAIKAYAYIHDCQECETLEWGLQTIGTDSTWDMFESYSEKNEAIGVTVKDAHENTKLFKVDQGISGVFECLNDGRVVESQKVLINKVKTEHVHNSQKINQAAKQNFKPPSER